MKKLSTEKYYVAYLDFLGMKKLVAIYEKDEYLNNLKDIYDNAIDDV